MRTDRNDGEQWTTLTVSPKDSGEELLRFLSVRFVTTSKTALRRLMASGRIRVEGSAAEPSQLLRPGETISVPPDLSFSALPEQTLPINVLHEDEAHLCVDKPAGHPVLPGRRGEGAEFYESLLAMLNREAPQGGPYVRPHLVHRLDRETSGVLLVAKSDRAGRALGRQFERHQVEKEYLGIIEGVLPRPELRLDIPLRRMPGSLLKMEAAPAGGKPASSVVRIKERFGHFALLEIRPLTGRQHQIRVHLAATGHPLAVDHLYGRREELRGAGLNAILGRDVAAARAVLLARCPLHAASIRYRHPGTGEPMEQRSPLPADLAWFVEILREADPHD